MKKEAEDKKGRNKHERRTKNQKTDKKEDRT